LVLLILGLVATVRAGAGMVGFVMNFVNLTVTVAWVKTVFSLLGERGEGLFGSVL
jgi:hypothetical protein